MSCAVCNAAPKKYKCPACGAPYCGLACFKEHKTACAGAAPSSAATAPARDTGSALQPENISGTSNDPASAAFLLPQEVLVRIPRDEGLLRALRDPRLQRVVAAVDAAPNKAKALEEARAKEGPLFQRFLDDVLIAMGLGERDAGGNFSFTG